MIHLAHGARRPALCLAISGLILGTAMTFGDSRGHGEDDAAARRTGDGFYPRDEAKEQLGMLLFWDKLLSGNMDISCATCHHSLAATGDGLSLPVGQAGVGTGITRVAGDIEERVPRNAPHVFNLGAIEFERLFHDGRVELLPDGSFASPAGPDLPEGLDNVLAVQAMFPVTSMAEMAGDPGDNRVANAAADGNLPLVWELLAQRLRGNATYVMIFLAVFDDIASPEDITFAHAANAIAAYEAAAFRADGSPYDRWLAGETGALSKSQERGLRVFRQRCAECHSGRFQTNHEFRAICMPQIGPGKGDNQRGYEDGMDDFGRERVTGLASDRFRFRVPSLRNVALTGPWGHAGAYNTLEATVRHHLSPVARLNGYDTSQAILPPGDGLPDDFIVQNDAVRRAGIAAANELNGQSISAESFGHLIDFLHALTDPSSLDLRDTVPARVPSGLPVFD